MADPFPIGLSFRSAGKGPRSKAKVFIIKLRGLDFLEFLECAMSVLSYTMIASFHNKIILINIREILHNNVINFFLFVFIQITPHMKECTPYSFFLHIT